MVRATKWVYMVVPPPTEEHSRQCFCGAFFGKRLQQQMGGTRVLFSG